MDKNQILAIEQQMMEEHQKDLEALNRLKRFIPANRNGSQPSEIANKETLDSVPIVDDAEEGPAISLRGKIKEIMDSRILLPAGLNVVITFKNSICLSGQVVGWTENNVLVLGSKESKNQMLVYNFDENVMFVKVILDYNEENNEIITDSEDNFTKVEEPALEIEQEDTVDTLIEKKKNNIMFLRNKISAHLHRGPGEIRKDYGVSYGYPDFSRR